MEIGVALPTFASDSHVFPPHKLKSLLTDVDTEKYAGVWLPEHLIEPPAYQSSYLDPLASLSAFGGASADLQLGTSILILPMRNPTGLAKRAATVQHLAENRLNLGLGVGYVPDEFDAVNVPFEERGPRFTEAFELVHRLLNEDRVTFDGEFYSVEDVRLEPNTPQAPRLLRGGGSLKKDGERHLPRSFKETMEFQDGWIALPKPEEALETEIQLINDQLEQIGRSRNDYDKILFEYIHIVPEADSELAARKQRKQLSRLFSDEDRVEWAFERSLVGSEDEIRERMLSIQQQGFDELVIWPIAFTPTEFRQQLRLLERVCPFL